MNIYVPTNNDAGLRYTKTQHDPHIFCSNSQWIGLVGKFYRKPWFLQWRSSAFPVIFFPSNSMYDMTSVWYFHMTNSCHWNSCLSHYGNKKSRFGSLHEVFQHVHGSGHHLSLENSLCSTHQAGMIQWQNHWEMMIYIYTGWWCNNHLEKWWSSSMGRMTSHLWNGK